MSEQGRAGAGEPRDAGLDSTEGGAGGYQFRRCTKLTAPNRPLAQRLRARGRASMTRQDVQDCTERLGIALQELAQALGADSTHWRTASGRKTFVALVCAWNRDGRHVCLGSTSQNETVEGVALQSPKKKGGDDSPALRTTVLMRERSDHGSANTLSTPESRGMLL